MQATISFTQITTTASLFSILQSFFHTAAHRAFQKGDIYITYVVFLSNIFKQNLTIRKQLDKSRFKFTLQENWSFSGVLESSKMPMSQKTKCNWWIVLDKKIKRSREVNINIILVWMQMEGKQVWIPTRDIIGMISGN